MCINPDANIVVAPSDQAIIGDEAFAKCINRGFDFAAKRQHLLTLGLKPTRPEPGYGYIQMGDEVEEGVFKVQSFTEKPEREFAQMFVNSGEFYWNTGIFLANARYLLDCFRELLPTVLRKYDEIHAGEEFDYEEENRYIHEHFPSYPNITVDYGILEKSENVCMLKCNFGWADLGTWHSIYEAMQKGEGDNVVIDSDVLLDDAHNNVIKLPKDRMAVISGLDGFIVAEEKNVLLICRKEDSSANVRRLVNEIQMKKGEEFI